MVDRVLDISAGNLDLEANAVLGQFLHDRLHPAYLSKGRRGVTEVRAEGLEPPRAFAHQDLNLERLPIPPRPRLLKCRCCTRYWPKPLPKKVGRLRAAHVRPSPRADVAELTEAPDDEAAPTRRRGTRSRY